MNVYFFVGGFTYNKALPVLDSYGFWVIYRIRLDFESMLEERIMAGYTAKECN